MRTDALLQREVIMEVELQRALHRPAPDHVPPDLHSSQEGKGKFVDLKSLLVVLASPAPGHQLGSRRRCPAKDVDVAESRLAILLWRRGRHGFARTQ